MSDVVFILGAGASRQCGAPLMADFLDVASHLYRTGQCSHKEEHFKRVFEAIGALQSVHSKAQLDLNNIESIFTAFEMANVLRKLPNHTPESIPSLIASLKEVIVTTLEQTIDFPVRGSHIGAPHPYGQFVDLLDYLREQAFPQQSISIITFNYDVALDVALTRKGLGPDYAVSPKPKVSDPIPLFKLHGSLNWASEKEKGEIHPLHFEDYFNRYSSIYAAKQCRIPIGSQLEEYFGKYTQIKVEAEPVIVPPTWNKAGYHTALSQIWCAAAQHLGEAESIFIIGYSLSETDSFFRLLYALGALGKHPILRLIVYNPDRTGEVDNRFRQMLGPGATSRYTYIPINFEEAIGDISQYYPKRR